jgi:hypothetical protein
MIAWHTPSHEEFIANIIELEVTDGTSLPRGCLRFKGR